MKTYTQKTLQLAGCIISDDQNRILLLHRNTIRRTHWELPGGKIQEGETPQECAIRELKEELGIDVEIIDDAGQTTFLEDDFEMHYYWFTASIKRGIPTVQESLFDELKYFSWEALKARNLNLSNNLKKLVQAHSLV